MILQPNWLTMVVQLAAQEPHQLVPAAISDLPTPWKAPHPAWPLPGPKPFPANKINVGVLPDKELWPADRMPTQMPMDHPVASAVVAGLANTLGSAKLDIDQEGFKKFTDYMTETIADGVAKDMEDAILHGEEFTGVMTQAQASQQAKAQLTAKPGVKPTTSWFDDPSFSEGPVTGQISDLKTGDKPVSDFVMLKPEISPHKQPFPPVTGTMEVFDEKIPQVGYVVQGIKSPPTKLSHHAEAIEKWVFLAKDLGLHIESVSGEHYTGESPKATLTLLFPPEPGKSGLLGKFISAAEGMKEYA